jgi:coproporphyrinogen III oxidase-like Fe-S oxidoreductase
MLGRDHTGDEALKALEMAKDIFQKERVTFDLIYARPGQTTNGIQAIHIFTFYIITNISIQKSDWKKELQVYLYMAILKLIENLTIHNSKH